MSPAQLIDAATIERAAILKRWVRAGAALRGVFDDAELARRLEVSRNSVGAWWRGALPEPERLPMIADETGLSYDELSRFLYAGGPVPTVPAAPGDAAMSAIREGIRRGHRPLRHGDPRSRDASRPLRARDSGAGSA